MFVFLNKFTLLQIVKKSKKYQEKLGIKIDDYIIASRVSQFYSKQSNPCSIERDNEAIQVSITKSTFTKLQMKKLIYAYQLSYFNLNNEKQKTEILYDNRLNAFTCSLMVPEEKIILWGTRKGLIIQFSLSDNKIKEEVTAHNSKVNRIIRLHNGSYNNHFASCSEINEVNIYSLTDGHLTIVKNTRLTLNLFIPYMK